MELDKNIDLRFLEVMGGEHPFDKPFHVTGVIENKAGVVEMRLSIKGEFDTFCARCLKPVKEYLDLKSEYFLVTERQNADNDKLILVEDNSLDLSEIVINNILIGMPLKSLCRENCKGLCPKCGKDLNLGDCDCPKKEIDSRFAVLKELLKD